MVSVISEWTPQHVENFLVAHYIHPDLAALCKQANINGQNLPKITKDTLINDMKFSPEDAVRVISAISQICTADSMFLNSLLRAINSLRTQAERAIICALLGN